MPSTALLPPAVLHQRRDPARAEVDMKTLTTGRKIDQQQLLIERFAHVVAKGVPWADAEREQQGPR